MDVFPSGDFYAGGWCADSLVGRFLGEMNRVASDCGAEHTTFVSPHGMGHEANLTTARDVLRISRVALEFSVLAQVVKTTAHTGTAVKLDDDGTAVPVRSVRWTNTNALLDSNDDVYDGIKTGWIPNAHGQRVHGCLASRVRCKSPRSGATELFVVVLGSTSKPQRFVDTQHIVSWAWDLPCWTFRSAQRGGRNGSMRHRRSVGRRVHALARRLGVVNKAGRPRRSYTSHSPKPPLDAESQPDGCTRSCDEGAAPPSGMPPSLLVGHAGSTRPRRRSSRRCASALGARRRDRTVDGKAADAMGADNDSAGAVVLSARVGGGGGGGGGGV